MKTKPYNRHETFLAALSDSSIAVPTPLSREELYLAKIAGESVTIPAAPYNRYETYLARIAGENVAVPAPASRLEAFLYKAGGGDIQEPVPASREEVFWKRYIGSESSGSTITITDAESGKPRSVVLDIELHQTFPDGISTPSPEHPCPISGWTEAVILIKDAEESTQHTYTIDISEEGAVYGGTLDVESGTLTLTHECKEFDGTESWAQTGSSGNPKQYFNSNLGDSGILKENSDVSSHFAHANVTSATTVIGARVYNSSQVARYAVRPGIDGIDSNTKMKSWVEEQHDTTPVQVVYKITNSHDIMVQPVTVELLPGYNKIVCNCGIISLKYTPDI